MLKIIIIYLGTLSVIFYLIKITEFIKFTQDESRKNFIEDIMRRKLTFLFALLLFFSSCKLIEEESNITEPTDKTSTSSVKVVSPNGGESLMEGSSFDIKWTATTQSKIRIQVTYDNGSSWFLVADSLNNTGIYNWFPIPNSISNQCKIRVATVDGSASSISEKVFSIIKNSNESLRIISPNGNEEWESGTSKQIKWYSSGIDSVRIEYTTNNGNTWSLIAVDKKNTGIYFWEPVPKTPSTLAKVRIKDAKDGVPFTESTNTFSILPEPLIKVIAPNGGEKIDIGSSVRIEWVSENIQNVSIEYTTDNGFSWTPIVNSTPSVGFYSWNPVPNVTSQLCKIRVADALDSEPKDLSDNTFSISKLENKSLTLRVPNGGENWEAGTAKQITWYSSTGIDSVYLEYTTDNGNTWKYIGKDTKNTGIYFWEPVPNTPSTLAKVRIKDAKTGLISDESNNTFNILPEPVIKVLVPNGGESWLSNTSQRIEWLSQNIANVKIAYTTNNGANWTTIVESTPSIGFYIWQQIPNINSQNCKIRIYDAVDGEPNDVSDGVFRITNQIVKTLQVTSPNGGEEWEAGSRQNITWNATAVNKVKIELTIDKGLTWTTLVDSIGGGAYEWSINENLNSAQCQIRITDSKDPNVSDVSDASFTISPRKYLFVSEPRGPRIFKDSDAIEIKWESTGIKNVGIKYTWNNGIAIYPNIPSFYTLVDKMANQGNYITSFTVPSDKYYVVVFNADDGSNGAPSARSIGNFTIEKTEPQTITMISPKNGDEWLTSDPQKKFTFEIRWASYNVDSVKIQYSLNGGATWKLIVNSYPSNGIYNWTMPEDVEFRSDNAMIRISSTVNPTMYAQTDGRFSIHPQTKLLRWTFPLGGEYLAWRKISDTFTDVDTLITWHSAGVYNVDIEYTDDNGLTWNTVVTNYRSTGAYNWVIPAIQPSTNARLRIIDVSADAGANPISDMTPKVFNLQILPAGSILFLDNNSNSVRKGTIKEINWTTSEDIKDVSIEYSLDGSKWFTIEKALPSKPGLKNSYKWIIPELDSEKLQIRILSGINSVKSTKFRIEK